jgi:hypothetical protein
MEERLPYSPDVKVPPRLVISNIWRALPMYHAYLTTGVYRAPHGSLYRGRNDTLLV